MPEIPSAPGARPNRRGRRQCLLGAAAALAVMGLSVAGPARAFRYEDQEFADTVQLGGRSLVLNGVGKRAVLSFRGYVAALYLARKADTAEAVLAVPGPKRVEMRMLLGVGVEELTKAVNKGVNRNSSEDEKAALAERLPLLIKNFELTPKVRKGDLITIDFLPEQGTVLMVNGQQKGPAVPGADLYAAFLKVFLGQRVSDERLKAGMLGRPT